MAYNWQLFLSSRPTDRTKFVTEETVFTAEEAIKYEFPIHKGLRAVRETHYFSNKGVRDGKSGPPLYVLP